MPTKTKTPKIQYADVSQRLLANIIDLVLLITFGILTHIVLYQTYIFNQPLYLRKNIIMAKDIVFTIEPIVLVILLLLGISYLSIYFLVMWVICNGQTIGKSIVGIKIISTTKHKLGFLRAFLRFLISLLSMSLFGLGYVFALFNKKKKAWQDLLTGTVVVKE
jgi:uncharacterized RDD family membrane protein YckC